MTKEHRERDVPGLIRFRSAGDVGDKLKSPVDLVETLTPSN
jgi:hypothetical protein